MQDEELNEMVEDFARVQIPNYMKNRQDIKPLLKNLVVETKKHIVKQLIDLEL